jgi:hypothetical protein
LACSGCVGKHDRNRRQYDSADYRSHNTPFAPSRYLAGARNMNARRKLSATRLVQDWEFGTAHQLHPRLRFCERAEELSSAQRRLSNTDDVVSVGLTPSVLRSRALGPGCSLTFAGTEPD